jgi:HTH-type transcriptional regulator, global nitrogen regulator NrpRI
MDKTEQHVMDILEILQGQPDPVNSADIAGMLNDEGNAISDRTIRHYLKQMDADGLTSNSGRRGRIITAKGRAKVETHVVLDKTGFLSARIDQMTYAMTFDLDSCDGTVVVNTILAKRSELAACLDKIERVFKYGYAMGTLATLIPEGQTCGPFTVPPDHVGFVTVCSVTLSGVLLKHGIPSHARFGGILELVDGKPRGFSHIIQYDGTTVDPLEVFIRSGMTNYIGAITTGTGAIGASFREIPADSRPRALALGRKLEQVGLGGIFEIARRSRPLQGIPVSTGRAGMIVIGGLNPASIFEESGIRIRAAALSGIMPYEQLQHYSLLRKTLNSL